jgi:hypothetical protein
MNREKEGLPSTSLCLALRAARKSLPAILSNQPLISRVRIHLHPHKLKRGPLQGPLFSLYGGRLHGCRRYDYMDVIGRIESGTEIESNAGAVAEREGFEPSMEFLAPYSLSRGVPSASRPPLQTKPDCIYFKPECLPENSGGSPAQQPLNFRSPLPVSVRA